MNSSQRRKSIREYPHVITLLATSSLRFFEHDDKVMTARNWCRWNCRGGFKVKSDWDQAEFRFATEKDAVHFALKWL